jgi:diguanylate cyclase (GGDEF)-like protein
MRVRTAWGEWRYMECLAVNLLDEPTIEGIILTARDVTDRHLLNLALEHAARHDELTGLPNRTLFTEHLSAALARYARRESCAALCYLDLDHFKLVNDEHGHAIGDQLLAEVAHRLRESLRPADIPTRLGGDEFGLILEEVTPDDALRVARRIWSYLDRPYELSGATISCSASIGIAMAGLDDTPDTWLARADAALYRAKRDGACVVCAEPDEPLAGGASPTSAGAAVGELLADGMEQVPVDAEEGADGVGPELRP